MPDGQELPMGNSWAGTPRRPSFVQDPNTRRVGVSPEKLLGLVTAEPSSSSSRDANNAKAKQWRIDVIYAGTQSQRLTVAPCWHRRREAPALLSGLDKSCPQATLSDSGGQSPGAAGQARSRKARRSRRARPAVRASLRAASTKSCTAAKPSRGTRWALKTLAVSSARALTSADGGQRRLARPERAGRGRGRLARPQRAGGGQRRPMTGEER